MSEPILEPKLEPILKLEGLKKHFQTTTGGIFNKQKATLKAVDGIDLEIRPGETIGLVGESGCGKTTAGRTILKLSLICIFKSTSDSWNYHRKYV